jgi:hypothetical protein
MTPRQDSDIFLAHLRNRHVTATETAITTVGNHNRHIHPKTVRNRLREIGLRARRPYIVFLSLVSVARIVWLGWRHLVPYNFQWGNGDGSFSQMGSRFNLFCPDGRRRGERFADAFVLERYRFGDGSVMVWGGIPHGATFTSERKTNVRQRARRPISRNRFLTVFGWMWRLWLPTVVIAVSVAVTWRLRRWARKIALSWRGVIMRGRPRRGRSATLLVSQ